MHYMVPLVGEHRDAHVLVDRLGSAYACPDGDVISMAFVGSVAVPYTVVILHIAR